MAVRRVWQQFSRLNPSVYSAVLRGGCCFPPCVADVGSVLIARFDVNPNKRRLLLVVSSVKTSVNRSISR